jgi:hypothetical protein
VKVTRDKVSPKTDLLNYGGHKSHASFIHIFINVGQRQLQSDLIINMTILIRGEKYIYTANNSAIHNEMGVPKILSHVPICKYPLNTLKTDSN